MSVRFWYCVNGSGQGKVFVTQPVRNEHRRIWVGGICLPVLRFVDWLETDCGLILPDITWDDEPVPIDINIENVYEGE